MIITEIYEGWTIRVWRAGKTWSWLIMDDRLQNRAEGTGESNRHSAVAAARTTIQSWAQ